jgi:hypothetical protein
LGDNGYEMKGDELVKLSTFYNFDIVMLGDIHEYQTFEMMHEKEIDESELEKYEKEGWSIN